MLLTDRLPGNDLLFQGDRQVVLRALPANAQVLKASVTVTPVNADGNEGPSLDAIDLTSGTGPHGETKTVVSPGWVEVDFHGRRTLVSVRGTELDNATLQVDMGGAYVEVNENGALLAPGDDRFALGNAATELLPGLTVARMKLTNLTESPDIDGVRVRNVASNVSLRLGSQPPFWTQVGELVTARQSADFAGLLQAFLAEAEVDAGFASIPLIVHSDSLTRLDLEVSIEFMEQQNALPSELDEVSLVYRLNGVAEDGGGVFPISLPAGARIDPRTTSAHIRGGFDNSRILLGPLDEPSPDGPAVEVVPNLAQAQPFVVQEDLGATAVDLLLRSASPTARLQLDLRGDLDGKPDSASLLAAPLTLNIDNETAGTPTWIGVSLPVELQFSALDAASGRPRRYWVVLASLEGDARWSVEADPARNPAGLQMTGDGGMSWRANPVEVEGPAGARFRLRRRTPTFNLPVQVQVGRGEQARRLDLSRFQPLGRVDFDLDGGELAGAIDGYLADTSENDCPRGEQLANNEFDLEVGNDTTTLVLADWELTGGRLERQIVTTPNGEDRAGIALGGGERPASGLSQVLPVSSGCDYELTSVGRARDQGVQVQLIWRGSECGVVRTDTLDLEHPFRHTTHLPPLTALSVQRLRTAAPEGATQLELRLVAPENVEGVWDSVSLVAQPQAIANRDLLEQDPLGIPSGWTVVPEEPEMEGLLQISRTSTGSVELHNISGLLQPMALTQRLPVFGGRPYSVALRGRVPPASGAGIGSSPELRLGWRTADGDAADSDSVLPIEPNSGTEHRMQGLVPATAAELEVALVLPDQTRLEIEELVFDATEPLEVPLVLLSEAPGDLSVSGLRVGYEIDQSPVPVVSDEALCRATPADLPPGGECDPEECFCTTCDQSRLIRDARPVLSPAGRPITVGTCINCESSLIRIGGARVPGAPLIPVRRFVAGRRGNEGDSPT